MLSYPGGIETCLQAFRRSVCDQAKSCRRFALDLPTLLGLNRSRFTMSDALKSVLVTGDVVLDCHLYGGIKTFATSSSEPGTQYHSRLGGAVLTAAIIQAAADAKGAAWDEVERAWKAETEKRQKEKKPPTEWPETQPRERPAQTFSTRMALDTANLESHLPENFRSFGVWTPHPKATESKDLVWR